MRAWQVHDLGEPAEVLSLEEVPDLVADGRGVLLTVSTCALNFADSLLCQGTYQDKPPRPFTPGLEVCARIADPGTSGLDQGQRVLAFPALPHGGLAQMAAAEPTDVHPLPDTIDDVTAATLGVTYQTGWFGLYHRARLEPSETVLVHAGAGGVGSAAIQLARARGARVIATAGGPDKVARCLELGAEVAIDYRADDFVAVTNELTEGRGADVIYDSVGGETFHRSRRCIAFEGRIVIVGFAGGDIADAPTNHLLVKNYSVVGLHWSLYRRRRPELVRAAHVDLVRLFEAGLIEPLVSEVRPLADAVRALTDLTRRATTGKIVIDCAGQSPPGTGTMVPPAADR